MDDDVEKSVENFWRPLIDIRFSPADTSRLKMMDIELAVLQKMRTRALRLRNECNRACLLPEEILVNIFLVLRDERPPYIEYSDLEPPAFRSGWMAITHVCSKWRSVSIGAPSLWADWNILGMPVQYIPTVLSRSRSCPMVIRVPFMEEAGIQHLLCWISQTVCPRVHHLYLEGTGAQQLFSLLLPRVSPYLYNLRTLYLDNEDSDTDVELPQLLCQMSHITHLTLKGIHLPWTSAILSTNIVELALGLNALDPEKYPTQLQFREVIISMCKLRSLRLTDVIPHGPPSGDMYLPRTLRSFEFTSLDETNTAAAAQFLAQLRFPDSCTRVVHVYTGEEAVLDNTVEKCLSALSLFGADGPTELHHNFYEVLILQDAQAIQYMRTRYTLQPSTIYPDRLQEIGSYAHIRFYPVSVNVSFLHLSELRVVTLYPPPGRSNATDVNQLFQHLSSCAPRVERAQLWISESVPFFHALMSITDTSFVLFPRLEVLVLQDGIHEDPANESKVIAELSALTALVELRRSKGSPLREIVVSRVMESWGTWDALKRDVKVSFL